MSCRTHSMVYHLCPPVLRSPEEPMTRLSLQTCAPADPHSPAASVLVPVHPRSVRTQSQAHPGSRPGPCQRPLCGIGVGSELRVEPTGQASGFTVERRGETGETRTAAWRRTPRVRGEGGADTECGSGEVPGSARDILRVEPGQGVMGKGETPAGAPGPRAARR